MPYEYFGDRRPYKHQLYGIKFMLKNKRGYLFLDMGTGKTCTSLWFSDILFEAGKINKVLIVAPLSTIRSVWAAEIQNVCPYRKYAIVHGTANERRMALQSDAKFFIINTDGVRNFKDDLLRLNPDLILIDEVTDFANGQSKRSRSMQVIASRCKSVFGLSGNPVAGGLIQSFGIAKVVNPSKLPTPYFTTYRDLILSQVNLYEYVPRPGAMAIVNETLSPAISYRLEDCVDLPPISFSTRNIPLPKETMKLFKEMLEHQIAEYKNGTITAATAGVKAIRLLQILTGFTKTEDDQILDTNCNPKFQELSNIYRESSNKLVVFAQSVRTVHRIKEHFTKQKIKVDLIYGDVAPKERDKIINLFQNEEEGVLVAQVRTMSHGVTLTKSHTIVFFGPVMGNETYRQAIRRIRRIGQDHPQTIVRLISSKFEETMFDKLDNKELTSQAVLAMYEQGKEAFL